MKKTEKEQIKKQIEKVAEGLTEEQIKAGVEEFWDTFKPYFDLNKNKPEAVDWFYDAFLEKIIKEFKVKWKQDKQKKIAIKLVIDMFVGALFSLYEFENLIKRTYWADESKGTESWIITSANGIIH